MGFFHTGGYAFGQASGYVLGEPVKFFGRITGSEFFQEVGTDIQKVSISTGQSIGQLGSGTVSTVKGLLTNNKHVRNEGLKELYAVMERTANGLETMVIHTAQNGKDIVVGVVDRDSRRLLNGTKGIAKTMIVGSVAVGIVDVIDGIVEHAAEVTETVDSNELFFHSIHGLQENEGLYLTDDSSDEYVIQTVNADIEGDVHDETGVPYEKETIELSNGQLVTGVYPDFQETAAVSIPEDLYLESDYVQFEAANSYLANQLELNPELRGEFSSEQLDQIRMGETPDGYVWHHHQVPGRLELVPEGIHAHTGHTGGRFIWGGGTEYR
ncbi:HNH endonuclease [Peribacillus kribbensis]|uniref:HNH endonuclease n=1 Tax=Peribacillus kribbensis TaxID=356658 RepID=UPI000684EFB0|nr:HNH endonuclease [Peribacillus kribbensis]